MHLFLIWQNEFIYFFLCTAGIAISLASCLTNNRRTFLILSSVACAVFSLAYRVDDAQVGSLVSGVYALSYLFSLLNNVKIKYTALGLAILYSLALTLVEGASFSGVLSLIFDFGAMLTICMMRLRLLTLLSCLSFSLFSFSQGSAFIGGYMAAECFVLAAMLLGDKKTRSTMAVFCKKIPTRIREYMPYPTLLSDTCLKLQLVYFHLRPVPSVLEEIQRCYNDFSALFIKPGLWLGATVGTLVPLPCR